MFYLYWAVKRIEEPTQLEVMEVSWYLVRKIFHSAFLSGATKLSGSRLIIMWWPPEIFFLPDTNGIRTGKILGRLIKCWFALTHLYFMFMFGWSCQLYAITILDWILECTAGKRNTHGNCFLTKQNLHRVIRFVRPSWYMTFKGFVERMLPSKSVNKCI